MAQPKGTDYDRVQKWNREIAELNQRSVTGRMVGECIAAYKKALKDLQRNDQLPLKTFRQFESSSSSFILWNNGYGISTGKLDPALARSKRLLKAILEPLVSISKTLACRLLPLLSDQDQVSSLRDVLVALANEAEAGVLDEDSDGLSEISEGNSRSSAESKSDQFDEIAEDLWTDVQCLIDLKSLIESPAPDIIRPKDPEEQVMAEIGPHLAFREQIGNKFPQASAGLIDRLAQANWERFLRTTSIREKNRALNYETAENAAAGAESLQAQSEQISKFNDSGLGTSIHTASAYAETVMSYRHAGQDSVRVPFLPAKAKKGEAFECLACGREVRAHNNSQWKQHLFSDLRPWVCHVQECSRGAASFSERAFWIQHLAFEHKVGLDRDNYECPFCFNVVEKGEVGVLKHLSDHLEEISLSALPLGDGEDEVYSESDESEDRNPQEKGVGFKCAAVKCRLRGLGWSNRAEFVTHLGDQHPDSACVYSSCPTSFRNTKHFDEHVDEVHLGLMKPRPSEAQPDFHLAQTSSYYWTVDETESFPSELNTHGSDWVSISKSMGTKTPIMVMSYYARHKNPAWEEIVRKVDESKVLGSPAAGKKKYMTGKDPWTSFRVKSGDNITVLESPTAKGSGFDDPFHSTNLHENEHSNTSPNRPPSPAVKPDNRYQRCANCRQRRMRCSGYAPEPGGKCQQCARRNAECIP